MNSIYLVYDEYGDEDTCMLVEDKETAKLYVKLGGYSHYEEIPLVTAEDLPKDIFEHYAYLREYGDVDDMSYQLSDEELKKKINEDSNGAIVYD